MDARFLVLLAVLGLAACDCGGSRLQRAGGELATEETQLDFGGACPAAPGTGLEVEPAVRTLHLRNRGNSLLYLNAVEIEAGMAEVFEVDRSQVPETIDAGAAVELTLRFRPVAVGVVVADLTLVGDDVEQPPVVVKLVGEGLALPPEPALALSCPGGKWDNDGCASSSPNYFFTDTPVGSAGEAALSFSNQGCAALVVESLRAMNESAGGDGLPIFSLADGQATGLRIPGGQRAEVRVRFAPRAEGAFLGLLELQTNAPASRAVSLPLRGIGVAAVLGLDPGLCDLRALVPQCDGRFSLSNAGGEELEIQSVRLQAGNPLFRLVRSPEAGSRVAAHSRLEGAIEVEYLPGPQRGSDLLVVETSVGSASAELRGGAPPVLRTAPEGLLDFGERLAVDRDYFLPVRLENLSTWAQQAPLTLRAVEIDARPPSNLEGTFALAGSGEAGCPEAPAPGTQLSPGAQLSACVRFHAAAGGGSYFANLLVRSDDPDFPDPAGLLLSLSASTTCNPAPVAQVSVPGSAPCPCASGAECVGGACHLVGSATVDLASGSLTLSGVSSYDLVPDATGACSERDSGAIRFWEWSLAGSPAGSRPSLSPEGKGEESQTTLGFDSAGLYLVGLTVYDDSGLPSSPMSFAVTVEP